MAELLVGYGAMPAHDLLRAVAACFHGIEPDRVVLGHTCARCGSDEHGRPVLIASSSVREPAHVSLARSPTLSIAAVTDAGRVGVDLEAEGAADFVGFADVAMHPDEKRRADVEPTQLWVRKEALLKASGLGLAIDPREVLALGPGPLSLPAVGGAHRRGWLYDLEVPGHRASVAVIAADPTDLDGLVPTVSRW